MKILSMGSLNLDYTYSVPHFVTGGETLSAVSREEHCGGKGLNQSIALARAGATVFHAGHIGPEGEVLKQLLAESGADVSLTETIAVPTGHAVIQVDPKGQNCILIFGGANREITEADVDGYLKHFEAGDVLLVQNETSCVEYAIREAARKGMKVALNPSPISEALLHSAALELVTWFILNEIEGAELTGEQEPERICRAMKDRFPNCTVMLTLGGQGCLYYDGSRTVRHRAFQVNAVDTTGAGDTFTGYFLCAITAGEDPACAVDLASRASALAVSRPGAAPSIPCRRAVEEAVLQLKP